MNNLHINELLLSNKTLGNDEITTLFKHAFTLIDFIEIETKKSINLLNLHLEKNFKVAA